MYVVYVDKFLYNSLIQIKLFFFYKIEGYIRAHLWIKISMKSRQLLGIMVYYKYIFFMYLLKKAGSAWLYW